MKIEKFPVQAPMKPLTSGSKAPGHPPLHDIPMERFDIPPVDPGPKESPDPSASNGQFTEIEIPGEK